MPSDRRPWLRDKPMAPSSGADPLIARLAKLQESLLLFVGRRFADLADLLADRAELKRPRRGNGRDRRRHEAFRGKRLAINGLDRCFVVRGNRIRRTLAAASRNQREHSRQNYRSHRTFLSLSKSPRNQTSVNSWDFSGGFRSVYGVVGSGLTTADVTFDHAQDNPIRAGAFRGGRTKTPRPKRLRRWVSLG